MNGNPVKLSDTKVGIRFPSPTLGQHNDDIFADLGYSEEEIAALKEKGAF